MRGRKAPSREPRGPEGGRARGGGSAPSNPSPHAQAAGARPPPPLRRGLGRPERRRGPPSVPEGSGPWGLRTDRVGGVCMSALPGAWKPPAHSAPRRRRPPAHPRRGGRRKAPPPAPPPAAPGTPPPHLGGQGRGHGGRAGAGLRQRREVNRKPKNWVKTTKGRLSFQEAPSTSGPTAGRQGHRPVRAVTPLAPVAPGSGGEAPAGTPGSPTLSSSKRTWSNSFIKRFPWLKELSFGRPACGRGAPPSPPGSGDGG